MYCPGCGTVLLEGAGRCPHCGRAVEDKSVTLESGRGSGIGYSQHIHDSALDGYLSNYSQWSAVLSLVLAATALSGFTLAGFLPCSQIRNPSAFLLGLVISVMFISIALLQLHSSNRNKHWDGVVVDKRVRVRRGSKSDSSTDDVDHYLYTVVVLSEAGKRHSMTFDDDVIRFDYFTIGDQVRYHEGLRSYEKYDKSRDLIIFCNSCGAIQPISRDYCSRCRCPLLK